MTLLLLTIPTQRAALVSWLEQNMTGLQLGKLVAELSALHQSAEELSLQEICGEDLDQVLESGLSVLSEEQFNLLLTNPMSLLDLQEQAFISGSPYWGQLASQGTAGRMAAATRPGILKEVHRLESKTFTGGTTATVAELRVPDFNSSLRYSPEGPTRIQSRTEQPTSRRPWLIGAGLTMACTAAMLFLALRNPFAEHTTGWGFDRADALTVQMTAPQFLEHLSQSGNEWFKKRPANAADLEQRLAEFSHGCQTLIDASLPQLDDPSRDWLRTKCRNWKDEIDGNLAQLQQSPERFADILSASDALIKRLTVTLRNGPTPSA